MVGKTKQVNQLINSLYQTAEISFKDNINVAKGMLNKSKLHLNPFDTKVLENNVCKVMSQ